MVAFNMEKIVTDISSIPEAWIYKWYAEHNDVRSQIISQPFDGRTIRIKSFTNRDSNPSLFIYCKDGEYRWKDHSSGIGGDASYFVQELLSKTWHVAIEDIKKQYDKFIEDGGNLDEYDNAEIIVNPEVKYEAKIRALTVRDLDFWSRWKIRANLLIHYKVEPLDSYSILKDNQIVGNFNHLQDCYGYYSKQQGLYQIYQPGRDQYKYINTKKDYLIGSEQLCYNTDVCIITSGLKDLMALKAVGLYIEAVAPKSENTIIPYDRIEMLKSKYKHVITMFDNDDAGLKAMNQYKHLYNIPFIRLNLRKDLAENNEKEELEFLKRHYTIYIDKLTN